METSNEESVQRVCQKLNLNNPGMRCNKFPWSHRKFRKRKIFCLMLMYALSFVNILSFKDESCGEIYAGLKHWRNIFHFFLHRETEKCWKNLARKCYENMCNKYYDYGSHDSSVDQKENYHRCRRIVSP